MIYNFTKTPVTSDRLEIEIRSSDIVTALRSITISGNDVTIEFRADLSQADSDILAAIVGAHTGEPLYRTEPRSVTIDSQHIDSNGRVKMAVAPSPHHTDHEFGSADALNVGGLQGVLANQQHIIPAEAVNAMGPKSNTNPLNHDRFQQSEISNLPESQMTLNHPTHSNANDPTVAQKQALDASTSPSTVNPFVTRSHSDSLYSANAHIHSTLPTANQKAAMDAAASPSGANKFTVNSELTEHTGNTSNPHGVTKSQINLGNCDNTSDADKPISTATQTALNGKLNTTLKGAVNGLAELDAGGKVPSSQLPAFVDDVVEYANLAAFPSSGSTGIIYVTLDTNKTYRWSGTAYVEISQGVTLGETSSTAYRGDRGKTAYDHSQLTSGNPHSVTKSDVSLGNVSNDAQLKIASNLSDLNNAAAARTSLGLGNSAVRNVGTGSGDVAAGLHTHPIGDITGVPVFPNNGTQNVLTELNAALSWTPKSTGGSSKRTFIIQVHAQNVNGLSNASWFRAYPSTGYTGSSSGWRGNNTYPFLMPFNCLLKRAVVKMYKASFDWRETAGSVYLTFGFYAHLYNGAPEHSKITAELAGSYSGTSLVDGNHTWSSEVFVVNLGANSFAAGELIGVQFRKDVNQPGQMSTIYYPIVKLLFEET
jgi:hypothetical protein